MLALVLGLVLQTAAAASQKPPPPPPKPTPAVQALLDQAAKLPAKDQLPVLQRAADLADSTHDLAGEGAALDREGNAYSELGQFDIAVELLRRAIAAWKDTGDLRSEADGFTNVATVYVRHFRYPEAFDSFGQALPLYQAVRDRPSEANILYDMGLVSSDQSQHGKAIEFYEKALPIFREIGKRQSEATTLMNIGDSYVEMARYPSAVRSFQGALDLYHQIGDQAGEANTLGDLGIVDDMLGRHATALSYFQRALSIHRKVGDRLNEAVTLTDIGLAYQGLSNYSEAIAYFKEGLPIHREIGDKRGEAIALANIGLAYRDLSQYREAIEACNEALPIFRNIGDRDGEAGTLENIGGIYLGLADYPDAVHCYETALATFQEVGDPRGQAYSLFDLSVALQRMGQTALAIALGKQEINLLQSIRSDIKDLDTTSQTAFRESVTDRYRRVAGWLTDAGRLAEAEQVLGLLKDEEYFRFLRRGAGGGAEKLDLTAREAKWLGQYEKLGEDLAALASRRETLLKVEPTSRTASQKAELSKLDDSVKEAQAAFQSFLVEVRSAFKDANVSDDKRLDDLTQAREIQKALTNLPGHPEAIYTFSAGDTVRVIVTAAGGAPLARQAPKKISSEELNRKILAFRAAVTDPRVDPRPLGAELYDLLVRPIEHDLASGKADTLMWNLDGALRYLPLAALYDDKTNQFLIEKYPCSIFTPRTVDRLTEVPKAGSAAGFGVSLGGKVNDMQFAALPGVPGEISAVKQALGGGTYDLDDRFTAKAFEDAMHDQPRIVHIATHFHFQPGDDQDSFLLLGGSQTLTVAQINDLPDDTFASVDTLTLSACQTALGGDGGEFESFALLAQLKGASAVLASLWSVSDESTALLMGEFYRMRKAHPEWTKLAALRAAQLEMLRGQLGGGPPASQKRSATDIGTDPKSDAPLWPKDRPRFSHPYYWAPFVLTGNWR